MIRSSSCLSSVLNCIVCGAADSVAVGIGNLLRIDFNRGLRAHRNKRSADGCVHVITGDAVFYEFRRPRTRLPFRQKCSYELAFSAGGSVGGGSAGSNPAPPPAVAKAALISERRSVR